MIDENITWVISGWSDIAVSVNDIIIIENDDAVIILVDT